MVIIQLILISLLYLLYRLFNRWIYSYWERHEIPSVRPTFPFGNLASFHSKEHLAERLAVFYSQYKKEGPIIGLYFMFEPAILVTDLDLVQKILIKDFQHFQRRTNIFHKPSDPLAANMFTVDYETWKPLRSKISSAFSIKRLRLMLPIMSHVADELVMEMTKFIQFNSETEVDISDWMTKYTMDVVDTCILGFNRRTLFNPNEKLLTIGKRVFDRPKMTPHRNALLKQFERVIKVFGFRSHYKDVTDYFIQVVKDTVSDRENNNTHRNDIMNILIGLTNSRSNIPSLTMEEVAAHAYNFFLAGFHSTSATLMYCLHELSMKNRKHIQDNARLEIRKVLEAHDGLLTEESLNQMAYIQQIILETMRIHPGDPEVTRTTTQAYEVPDTKFTIPVGMKVKIPVFAIHHDPEIYENPEEFIPERFSSENVAKRHACSFLAFGNGPRNCIAYQHAKHQVQIGLVKLLSNFEFSLCSRSEIPLKYDGRKNVLRPNQVWLSVKPIQ